MVTVGILGGGQLGRMLALAGIPLGVRFRFLDPTPDAPVRDLGDLIVGNYDDPQALSRFAAGVDLVTYEFENVPAATARHLSGVAPIYPPPVALDTAQDRLVEKRFFNRIGIPTPKFLPVDDADSMDEAVRQIGLPAVLKTRREGYDGKGQMVLREVADLEAARATLDGRPRILEAFVPFDREVAMIGARGRDDVVVTWPLVEIEQRDGVLHRAYAPARDTDMRIAVQAQAHLARALSELDYVGVLTIEFFVRGDDLLGNEMAPRVHNSGHWTIEGAVTSQFENHLRAILGLPLGVTDLTGVIGMHNLLGSIPDARRILQIPDTHLHLYGKAPRPGRKLGHVTVRAADVPTRDARMVEVADVLAAVR